MVGGSEGIGSLVGRSLGRTDGWMFGSASPWDLQGCVIAGLFTIPLTVFTVERESKVFFLIR